MPNVAVLPFYRVGATPLALEIMRIYNAGSSVYASCYSDAGGTTPMGNSDLVPIQADGNGLFPVVFLPVNAAYDIKFYSVDLVPRDTYEGIKPAGGSGGTGIDNYTVMISAADTAAGYLGDKLLDSTTVTWHIVNAGGYEQLQAQVNPAGVLDGKVKVDAGDANPGYLQDKLVQGRMMSLTLDGQQIVVAFDGPDYVPKTGGNYTGSVTFEDVIIAQGGCLFGNTLIEGLLTVNGTTTLNGPVYTGNTFVQGTLALPGIPGTGAWLTIDVAGNVTRTSLPNLDDHLVIASVTDLVPGPLNIKLQPGAGIALNVTTDVTLGELISISLTDLPTPPLVLPATQVAVGNGTGVTSYTGLTYTTNDLVCGAAEMESFFVSGDGPFAAFHNTAANTHNFRDGFSQHVNGDVRIGAAGSYGAIKITDATKVINTGIDTTLRIDGKLLLPGVEITTPTYALPELTVPGQSYVVRFTAGTGTTVSANATQTVRYRSSSTGASATAAPSTQVDATLLFGAHASSKVQAITVICVDANTLQVQY